VVDRREPYPLAAGLESVAADAARAVGFVAQAASSGEMSYNGGSRISLRSLDNERAR